MTVRHIGSAAIVILFGVVALIGYRGYLAHYQSVATENQRREPILVPGVQEPAEMRVEPFPANKVDLTAPERMLGEALENSDKRKPATLLPALNRILTQYPDFSDGYVMRAFALCDAGNERSAIAGDLDRAIKSIATSRTGKESLASLLSTRAKIEYLNGDYVTALNDLDNAIRSDLSKADTFPNSGATKPEQTASVCTWTQPDMDALVQRFPTDYRSYLFRGLYFYFFTHFNDDEALRKAALDDFHKASQTNGSSALPHYFAAKALLSWSFIKQVSMSDEQRKAYYREPLDELNKALANDPDLPQAFKKRADIYFSLKRYQEAIRDYDKILVLDPNDGGAYNDRGLAKMELGKTYDAISDFEKAIKHKDELWEADRYETRAAAYVKTQQWDLAIRDLTTAISLRIGAQVFLMSINRFRAVYPEYRTASDEAVARKLQRTFCPNLNYKDFSERFLHANDASFPDFVVADTYVKRSDAYFKANNWRAAKVDYQRAERISPEYAATDRWREISFPTVKERIYVDMGTFSGERREAVNLWIKQTQGLDDSAGPYSVQQFEINCQAHQTRMISRANYDAAGSLIGSRQGDNWASIVPESIGENLYNGACAGR